MDPADVQLILTQAAQVVTDAVKSPALQPIAFEKAIDMLLGTRAPIGVTGEVVGAPNSVAPKGGSPATTGTSLLDKLAARLRLPHEVVEAVYTVNGDALAVTVPPDKLSKARSIGAREIALLVAAATQADSEEPTTAEEIRKAVVDYDKMDTANFASALADLKGTFLIGGSSRARTYKLTKPGWAAAVSLIARLGGADKAAN